MTFLRRLRTEEHGFSLTELLTAMVIGSVVLWALMTLMTTGFTKSLEVSDRADAASNGRAAMDRITTLIDSTICLDPINAVNAIPPLIGSSTGVTGSDGNYIAFYADLNGVSATPDKYTITYDPTAKTLVERRYDGSGTLPNITFANTPSVNGLVNNVVPARDPVSNAQLPIFRYYKFETDGSINMASPMATPITQALAGSAVRVVIAFKMISPRTKVEDKRATTIEGQSSVGTPDPNTPNAGNCP